MPTAIRAGPVGIGGRGLGFKQISVVLFKRFQCGPDICLLVLAGAKRVNIQQGGNRLCIAALGGGNGALDASIKGHAVQLVLPLSVLVGKLAGQLLDFSLELVDVHALERLKLIFGGLELRFHGFVVRKGLLSGFDKSKWIVIYGVSLLICGISTFLNHTMATPCMDSLIMSVLMCAVFGAYFCCFVRMKLSRFYDENNVNIFYDGPFRMHVPGVNFNNRNWPHIVQAFRLSLCLSMILMPILNLLASSVAVVVWENIGRYVLVVIMLCSIFLPIYVVGKKYE